MNARVALLLLSVALSVAPVLNAEPRIERGRYYGPANDFSIAYDALYVPSYEVSQPNVTLVDFRFTPREPMTGYLEVRNVEWVTVPSEVPQAQFADVAKELIDTYKGQRLPEHNFNVVNAKLETGGKVPHYAFVAHGKQKDAVFLWHGAVFFFGNRMALVSAVFSPLEKIEASQLANAMPDKAFMGWARTIRPEDPSKVAQNKR